MAVSTDYENISFNPKTNVNTALLKNVQFTPSAGTAPGLRLLL